MPNDVYTPELTPELLAQIREYAENDLPIGSTTAKEWLRAQQAEIETIKRENAEDHGVYKRNFVVLENLVKEAREELQQSREENERLRYKLQQIDGQRMDAEAENERLSLDLKITKAELNAVEKLGLKYQGELERHRTPRPINEWHEGIGFALWWALPIDEPPYCGTPLCSDWPGYHTHWTPFIEPISLQERR